MQAIQLKAAHLKDPLGIDIKNPWLSWTAEGGIRQTAYQITAVCEGEEVWNTGKVPGSAMHAVYGGPAASRMRVEWRVTLWDENDVPGAVSAAWFEFALLEKADWRAKWIDPETAPFDAKELQPASVLVKTFNLERTGRARIYATAHGIYVLNINGTRVTENILTPGTSEYWHRLPYQTFDVSGYLRPGKNRIEVTLGDGWYRGCNGNTGNRNVFGTDLALLLQLEIDGRAVLVTDESWQAAQDGPILSNDIQLGERVDARKVPTAFHGVQVKDFGYGNLICANTLPLKAKEAFPGKLMKTPDGATVLDFGQNMAGVLSFRVQAKAGQKLVFHCGEYLDQNGNFCDDNLQTYGRKGPPLHQVVEYICKDGLNEYVCTLCIFGFAYAKLETDLDEEALQAATFTAYAVYSDMEETASFASGHALIDRFFQNAIWSEKSNFVDIPTDCPQRERSGWTGDAGVFVHCGTLLMDSYPVYERFLAECRAAQYEDGRVANIAPRRAARPTFMDGLYDGSCGWGDAVIIIPYTLYKQTGDEKILRDNYEMMRRWLLFCEKRAGKSKLKNLFRKNPFRKYTVDTGIHWGEWLEAGVTMEESTKEVLLKGVPDIATAYYAFSSRMLAEIASVLGKTEDAGHFKRLAAGARKAYQYLELKDGHIRSDRQCRFVRPLYMGLLDEEAAKAAAADLNALVVQNNYHLNTGFLTTGRLCEVLAQYGYVHTAYRVLLQEDVPGWLYQVKQGATTVWESWEGCAGSTGVSSLNHYSKGAVAAWFIQGICGIRAEGQSITIRPQPDALLGHAKAVWESPVGRIGSGWRYEADGRVTYTVSIPSNTTAVFIAPDGSQRELAVGENQFCI